MPPDKGGDRGIAVTLCVVLTCFCYSMCQTPDNLLHTVEKIMNPLGIDIVRFFCTFLKVIVHP